VQVEPPAAGIVPASTDRGVKDSLALPALEAVGRVWNKNRDLSLLETNHRGL
jgi:hypothetical protein